MKKVDIDVKFVNFYGSLEGGDDIYRQRLKFWPLIFFPLRLKEKILPFKVNFFFKRIILHICQFLRLLTAKLFLTVYG